MVATITQNGKLLKPQTLEDNTPDDWLKIKNTGIPGVTKNMADKTKPTDYDWGKKLVPVRKDN